MQITLTAWQKKQCASLYYLASRAYLQRLDDKVDALLQLASDTAELATRQNRDCGLHNDQWGDRDTVANWKNHAWPILLQLRSATTQAINARADEIYGTPDFHYFHRGFNEYSLAWTSPAEEQAILAGLDEIGDICTTLDSLSQSDDMKRRLNDVALTRQWDRFAVEVSRLPKFRIRTDLSVASFDAPPRTGVYIVLDDPHASPQFAFAGRPAGHPRRSTTFSYLGHLALRHVGRRDLWRNPSKMLAFATSAAVASDFDEALPFGADGSEHAAISAVAAKAFRSRSCTWTYVEQIDDEYDEIADCADDPLAPVPDLRSGFIRRLWELTCSRSGT